MTPRRVAVVGGGPAGLFAARQIALSQPSWAVRVNERLPPEATFGFGVGLTGGLLDSLAAADPALHEAVGAAAVPFSSAVFRLPEGDVELGKFHSGAIGRATLLRILLDGARAAGVEVVIGGTSDAGRESREADIVVAADGVSSATRAAFADGFGARVRTGRGAFLWCAAPIDLDGTVFAPVDTPDGQFVAHAYPYTAGMSTFVVEAGPATLERAGFIDRRWSHDGESDDAALGYLSEAFSDLLGGARFVGNRSRWSRFLTVTCDRWHHGNVVLLGDAAATAHPSLGSGTKIAIESAIALAAALAQVRNEPPADALAGFEAARRPGVERLQDRAHRSQLWWESFSTRGDLTPARLAAAYLSRAGAVSLDALAATSPTLARQAVADFAGVEPQQVPDHDLPAWVLARPLTAGGNSYPGRLVGAAGATVTTSLVMDDDDPWGSRADELVGIGGAEGAGTIVRITGAFSRGAVLDRLALGERMRREAGAVVETEVAPETLGLAVDGLVAGRTDLVSVRREDS